MSFVRSALFPRMFGNIHRFNFSVTSLPFSNNGAVVGTLQNPTIASLITLSIIFIEWCE